MAWNLSRATSAACSRRLAMRTHSGTFSYSMPSHFLPKQLDEQVAKLQFRALWEHELVALVKTQVKALDFKRNYGFVKRGADEIGQLSSTLSSRAFPKLFPRYPTPIEYGTPTPSTRKGASCLLRRRQLRQHVIGSQQFAYQGDAQRQQLR